MAVNSPFPLAPETPIASALKGTRRARKKALQHLLQGLQTLVGAAGFELATLCSQSRCATRLRYAPTARILTRQFPCFWLIACFFDFF